MHGLSPWRTLHFQRGIGTVQYSILIDRLAHEIGVTGTALIWFHFYFSGRLTQPRRVSGAEQSGNMADPSNVIREKRVRFWADKMTNLIIFPPEVQPVYNAAEKSVEVEPATFLLTPGWLTWCAFQLRHRAMFLRRGRFNLYLGL